MLSFIYPRVWPIFCLGMGIIAALGTHLHFEIAGLSITNHNLMWFAMAFAHADVYWRRRDGQAATSNPASSIADSSAAR